MDAGKSAFAVVQNDASLKFNKKLPNKTKSGPNGVGQKPHEN